jgi:3-dehydroquinate synthase
MAKVVKIKNKEYPILLHVNAAAVLDAFIEKKAYSKFFVLMDENTYSHCFPLLADESRYANKAELLIIEAGEENKTIDIAKQLWQSLTEGEADRHSLLINLGGGLISDLGGFVAATFKRGMDFVNIPTSLLAMVDASIGGKTGVNLDKYKNQIGLFSTPKLIAIDFRFLDTLPQRELVSAYAEMVKHGLIADKAYWKALCSIEKLNSESLKIYIETSIRIKKAIVDQDPTEKGVRKILNFGHTIGHAIETFFMDTQNPVLHGEAVAFGMLAEAYLSAEILNLPQAELKEIESHIQTHFAKLNIAQNQLKAIAALVNQDKKKNGNELNFSLLENIEKCAIDVNVNTEQIVKSLSYSIHGSHNQ